LVYISIDSVTFIGIRGCCKIGPIGWCPPYSLSEPLIGKNEETKEDDQEREEEATLPLSSIGVIIGSVLLGAAG
jgi:hypothetical protein